MAVVFFNCEKVRFYGSSVLFKAGSGCCCNDCITSSMSVTISGLYNFHNNSEYGGREHCEECKNYDGTYTLSRTASDTPCSWQETTSDIQRWIYQTTDVTICLFYRWCLSYGDPPAEWFLNVIYNKTCSDPAISNSLCFVAAFQKGTCRSLPKTLTGYDTYSDSGITAVVSEI